MTKNQETPAYIQSIKYKTEKKKTTLKFGL